MTKLITVKANTYNHQVGLWQKHESHPSGEAYVTDGVIATVALTDEVATRLANSLLVEVDASEATEPWVGYDSLSADAVVTRMKKLGEIERIVLRQYEATHQKRTGVMDETFQPEPWPDYDQMTAPEVLEHRALITAEEWDRVREYEAAHKNRKTIVETLD